MPKVRVDFQHFGGKDCFTIQVAIPQHRSGNFNSSDETPDDIIALDPDDNNIEGTEVIFSEEFLTFDDDMSLAKFLEEQGFKGVYTEEAEAEREALQVERQAKAKKSSLADNGVL